MAQRKTLQVRFRELRSLGLIPAEVKATIGNKELERYIDAAKETHRPASYDISLPAEVVTIIGLYTVPSTTLELMGVTTDNAQVMYRGRVFWRDKTSIERRGLVFDEQVLEKYEVSWYFYYRFVTKHDYGTAAIWSPGGVKDLQSEASTVSAGFPDPDALRSGKRLLVLTPSSVDYYATTFYSTGPKRGTTKSAKRLDQYTIRIPGVITVSSIHWIDTPRVLLLRENGDLFDYDWRTNTIWTLVAVDVVDLKGTRYLTRDGISRDITRTIPLTPIASINACGLLGWARSGDAITDDGLVRRDRIDPFGDRISGKHYVESSGNGIALDPDGSLYYYDPISYRLIGSGNGAPITKYLGPGTGESSIALIY